MQAFIMNTTAWTYRKKVLTLIAAIGILRLILAFTVQLGNDESYYWLYSQHLKSNYFDHPPMIALVDKSKHLEFMASGLSRIYTLGQRNKLLYCNMADV